MAKNLMSIFGKGLTKKATLDEKELAKFLKVSPAALKAFEDAYQKKVLDVEEPSNNFFRINSRQVSAMRSMDQNVDAAKELANRIVKELLADTVTYSFDGNLTAEVHQPKALPAGTNYVTNEEIKALSEEIRPELSGNLMKVDIRDKSIYGIMFFYQRFLESKDPHERQNAYHHFRQGLDILDLDPITYEVIGMNRNSMGHWFPQLVEACKGRDFFKIPATTIAKVPMPLLQLTRQEYSGLTQTTLNIVDQWAMEAFHLDENKDYFIKTGTYSSKFDFRNAHVHGPKEVHDLGEYLLFIHFQALMMASPLSSPCIYGASTTNEWVVREYIQDKEDNPSIYMGLPLHTEYRVFIDCDTKEVIGIHPYWDPDVMKQRFQQGIQQEDVHMKHDYVTYAAHEETLMRRYKEHKDEVVQHVAEILPDLKLTGQWSLDIMQNGGDFWLIDMGVAENSAFYQCVPEALRRPVKENWIPSLES